MRPQELPTSVISLDRRPDSAGRADRSDPPDTAELHDKDRTARHLYGIISHISTAAWRC